jgi:hypothetical protein
MKTVVLDRDMIEMEVRPHVLLAEYRRLLAQGVAEMLLLGLKDCICPGCGGTEKSLAFSRFGMNYCQCPVCHSLFVSPRPTEAALISFYRESEAARFWRQELLPATREARRAKLFQPRAQWLLDAVDEFRPQARRALAVGYHNELLLEELLAQEQQLFEIVVANPVADIEFAGRMLERVCFIPTPMHAVAELGQVDLFLAFDILDRCPDLEALFVAARSVLLPGGLLLGTTILGSGFDIQVLWERAEGIHPPERLNLLTVEGMNLLFERHGFEVLEFSTPGMFDAEEVQRAVREQPGADWPRFIRYLAENRGEEALGALQEFLQRFRLSSFARIVLRRLS